MMSKHPKTHPSNQLYIQMVLLLLLTAAVQASSAPTLIASTQDKNGFTGFAFPYLANGHIVFNGHAPGLSGLYTANLSDPTASIRTIVSTDEGFTTFSAPFVAKEGTVYLARSVDGSEGIFLDTHSGKRSTVVDTSTRIPGSDLHFWYLAVPSMNDQNEVVFLGSTAHATTGIFKADTRANIVALADDRTSIPNRPNAGFAIFSGPQVNEDGTVVFFGSAPASPRYQIRRHTIGTSYQDPTLLFGSQATGQAPSANHALHLEPGAYGNEWNEPVSADELAAKMKSGDDYRFATPGIYAADSKGLTNGGASVKAIADWTTQVPSCEGSKRSKNGELFAAFSDASISGDFVAFVARGDQGSYGVFRANLATGTLTCMADTGRLIPGTSSYFGDFPQRPSVHRDGSVYFRGLASGTKSGMYFVTAQGSLKAIVTMDSQFEGGSAPVYMGAAGNAYDGNRLAFYAVTDNSMDGVYYASI
jgi:hypothetical protein